MKGNMQLRQDVAGATIGILVGLLIVSCIAIFWPVACGFIIAGVLIGIVKFIEWLQEKECGTRRT